jgi:hypothetical protein
MFEFGYTSSLDLRLFYFGLELNRTVKLLTLLIHDGNCKTSCHVMLGFDDMPCLGSVIALPQMHSLVAVWLERSNNVLWSALRGLKSGVVNVMRLADNRLWGK